MECFIPVCLSIVDRDCNHRMHCSMPLLLFFFGFLFPNTSLSQTLSQWTPSLTGSVRADRADGILLRTGDVLRCGGSISNPVVTATNLCETYNPSTGLFAPAGSLTQARGFGTMLQTNRFSSCVCLILRFDTEGKRKTGSCFAVVLPMELRSLHASYTIQPSEHLL